ncbi:WPP domain-interacting tail-anchored protein 1 isoform X2 [Sorghum bicolor]|uniref:WPP domain-interacting tail-anchored protein 1 isoform X2 n=1 Tax=Sorghum bicolor TaxID=4558 RepID=UPI000B424755|nr:WPP domain-interacting tail-anchored protein 1 isoform X2 [Sorghum bicolor]|eukprot:XP_021303516.1 WPP domain-interacting tail-anchored protein 1 isoform X2 [Sorghum bicolor]
MDTMIYKHDDISQERTPPFGDAVNMGGSNVEILTRVEVDMAFASEKLLNLEMLVMEIARQATDFDPATLEDESISSETAENAFELDILYGILDAEVKELHNLISSLQADIKSIEHQDYEEESGGKVKARMDAVKLSLKQMQELIADIRNESAKFEKVIAFPHDKEAAGCDNGHLSYQNGTQTEEQHRNVLHMLEKSIASELDLEKKLSDSISVIEDLRLKLHHQEEEIYFLEESTETVSGRLFEAENASELLFGTSKELIDRLNNMQFHVSALKCTEDDLKSKLEQSLTKSSFLENSPDKVEKESDKVGAGSPSLQDKIQELEKQLNESNLQLQLALASAETRQEEQNALQSELSTMENTIKNIKDDVSRAESRAQNAEIRCMQLTVANIELNGELDALKSEKSDKANLLEKKLTESNTQLEHAKAAVDAIVEQQGMLKCTMSDMEHIIEDLKGKVSKAETRAESAESKCTLLTDTNLELSEELAFLRGRVESLENLLREANHAKVSTAKDIGVRTKIITDLVIKLALERERLHLQIATLTKKNKMLVKKCKEDINGSIQMSKKATSNRTEFQSTQKAEEICPDSLPSQTVVTTCHMTQYLLPSRIQETKCCNRSCWIVINIDLVWPGLCLSLSTAQAELGFG